MAETVILPRQGNTVESCVILTWKKDVGDSVAVGDILCEVETDKATFEVESSASGVVLARFFDEGDDVPVLTPLVAVGEAGEDISGLAPKASVPAPGQASESKVAGPVSSAAVKESSPPSLVSPSFRAQAAPPIRSGGDGTDGRIAVSPRARRLAERSGLDPATLSGSGTGPGGRIIERDVQAAIDSGQPLTAAAKAARTVTGRPAPLAGTGIGGRVRTQDLDRRETSAETRVPAATTAYEFPGAFEDVAVSGVRKIIAERMHASLKDTAQLTLQTSADARSILRYRKLLKASEVDQGLRSITINDIVLYAAVRTIVEFPDLNAYFNDASIRKFSNVHAAFAVDTDRGLMVPVVRFADTLSLRELSSETNRLASACQSGKVNPDELTGGTVTVSNLGALGVEMFTPILNPPQVAILGVCSIEQKPVQGESGIELVPHIGFSLTIDHRGVDGSPAAWFLKRLGERIANFELMLAG